MPILPSIDNGESGFDTRATLNTLITRSNAFGTTAVVGDSRLGFHVLGGMLVTPSGPVFANDDIFNLPDNTPAIYIGPRFDGVWQAYTTGWTQGGQFIYPCWIVSTVGGLITTLSDERSRGVILPIGIGTGTVTQINQGTGMLLTPNPGTTVVTVALANTTVTPATYGDSTHVPQFAVNAQGQVTGVTNVLISGGGGGGGTVPNASSLDTMLYPTDLLGSSAWVRNALNLMNPVFGDPTVIGPRAVIQAGVDYGIANNKLDWYIPCAPLGTIDRWYIDGPIFFDPPNNLRNGITLANQKLGIVATPTMFINPGPRVACAHGTRFFPLGNWATAPMFWASTAKDQIFENFFIEGPGGGRASNTLHTGFAIPSGNGGAQKTVINNCRIEGCGNGITMGQNGQNALAEDNKIFNTVVTGANYGIKVINGQALVNAAYACEIQGQFCAFYTTGQDFLVWGGEHGTFVSSAFEQKTVSAVSALTGFTDTLTGGNTFTNYTFTAVIGSPGFNWTGALPDGTFVFNACCAATANFGLVPFRQIGWNAGTSTATFQFDSGWMYFHFGHDVNGAATDLAAEMAAVTTFYCCSRSTVFMGHITACHCHIESTACQALYATNNTGSFTQRASFYSMDTGNWNPVSSNESVATGLNNQIWPWLIQTNGTVVVKDTAWTCDAEPAVLTAVIQGFDYPDNSNFGRFIWSGNTKFTNVNLRYVGKSFNDNRQQGPVFRGSGIQSSQHGSNAYGFGEFEQPVWGNRGADLGLKTYMHQSGTGWSKHIGYQPDTQVTPRLTMENIAAVETLTGNIPFMFGNMLYKVNDGITQGITHVMDVGGNGYAWHRNLNISWSCKGKTQHLNVANNGDNPNLLFPGLEIGLVTDAGTIFYIVNGGYGSNNTFVTLVRESNTNTCISGVSSTVYTGTSIIQRLPILSYPGQTRSSRNAAQFSKTNNTLAPITGIGPFVFTGLTYDFVYEAQTTSIGAAGVQFDFNGGTATMTSFTGEAFLEDAVAGLRTQTRLTALNTNIGATPVTVAYLTVKGRFVPSATGTFKPQFAQNVTNGSASVVLQNSVLKLTEVP